MRPCPGQVWWKTVGSAPGTAILTLHGGPGAGHDYLMPMAALASDRRLVFYDQLGCGRPDSPTDEKVYTIQRTVNEVDAVRMALGLGEGDPVRPGARCSRPSRAPAAAGGAV